MFAGEEHPCVNVVGTMNDVKLYEKQVYVISGDYLFVVTASSALIASTADIMRVYNPLAE